MKKILCFLMAVVLISVPVLSMAEEPAVKVELNGTEIEFPDAQPVIKDGRTLVPMRAIFEALGAGVYWEETDQTIFSQLGSTFVIMQIDSPLLFVNDAEITLDVPPQLMGERTMVPLRAVSESFGLNVEWDEESWTVRITNP